MSLRENYDAVSKRIADACNQAGRDRNEVTLVAVSKTKPVEMIEEMATFGQTIFGENHVQEIVAKEHAFPQVSYHMIGHLQRNKVRQVVGKVEMIHSVDTVSLAKEISKESLKKGLTTDILLEINVGNEESKYGFSFDDICAQMDEIEPLPAIRIRGFMCVAPYVENPEENRPLFRRMKELLVDRNLKRRDNNKLDILSMGMTNDFEVAIQEGATHVRIGTALFGHRDYGGNEK